MKAPRQKPKAGLGLYALPTPVNTAVRSKRILMGTPTLGQIRMEWHNALAGMIVPCNWSMASITPLGFLVADGQNLCVYEAIKQGFEWLFLLEDDVIPPPDFALRLADYLNSGDTPIVSGLYHLRGSNPREPLMYRGRGNGAFTGWKPGEKVWCDGVPTGALLVHLSIFKELAKIRPEYAIVSGGQTVKMPQYFETPRESFIDAQSGAYMKLVGTSDLYFCDMVMNHQILQKAGWGKIGRRKYPFLVDTRIACGHIDRETGAVW